MKISGDIMDLSLRLVIGTKSVNAEFVVETSGGVIAQRSVSNVMPVSEIIPIEYQVVDNSFENRQKGIRVYTTNGERIFIIAASYYLDINYGVYLVYPCLVFNTELGYEYHVISTEASAHFHSQVLVVGCEDDTIISITPSKAIELPQDLQLSSSNPVPAAVGVAHNRTINRKQTLLLTSSSDLTGTRITSNKPLAVIAGHECAHIPYPASGCEPFAIQVPPTFTWGTRFLLTRFAGRETGSFFKVLATQNTSMIVTCGNSSIGVTVVANTFQFSAFQYCSLRSSKPVLVVQQAASGISDNSGDPAISLISPTDQYISNISFATLPPISFPNNYISVTVLTEHFNPSSIFLDGEMLECYWIPIYDDDDPDRQAIGYGCSKALASGREVNDRDPTQHEISHRDPNGRLSVLVYGFNSDKGYAYLAGQEILPGYGKIKF